MKKYIKPFIQWIVSIPNNTIIVLVDFKEFILEYWMPDDTKEIEALEAAGVQLLPKPPKGIPLLKTPPPSVLCEPMSGKYLEFSGPREMCPLPGETYPHLAVYRVIVSEQQREMTDNFILDFISDKELAEVDDVQVRNNAISTKSKISFGIIYYSLFRNDSQNGLVSLKMSPL